jgi:integrase
MLMEIKHTHIFLLEKESGKPDAKLRFRVKWNHNRSIVSFNVGYRVDVDKWSVDTQRCKNNTTHGKSKVPANVINREIQRFENTAQEVFAYFERIKETPDMSRFRAKFNDAIGRKKENRALSFFEVFDEYVGTAGVFGSWAETTSYKYAALRAHLKNYGKKFSLETLSEEILIGFVRYLQSSDAMQLRHKKSELGMRNTTVKKNVTLLKSFLRWAHKKKFYDGDLHETFSPKFKGLDVKEVIHLSWSELIRLYNFEFKNKDIERTRDVFCFLCFTSLRYSDAAKLRRSDVRENHLHVVTKKTVEGLNIELNKYSRAILEKYKNEQFPDDKALPVLPNKKMNEYVKAMAEEAGFDEKIRIVYFVGSERYEEVHPKYELITTHCGRRTFIVNALYLGIPAEVVMKWTGHSDYDAMKPYIKIVDELKVVSMKKFDEKN